MHIFSQQECEEFGMPERMNDPFRYYPHPLVSHAADIVRNEMGQLPKDVLNSLIGGKMLGVLIVSTGDGRIGFLKGISGLAGGRNDVPGFVPPVFDITAQDGFFKKGESEINEINKEISNLIHGEKYRAAVRNLQEAKAQRDTQLLKAKELIVQGKADRRVMRRTLEQSFLESLDRESSHQKAEYRRLKARLDMEVASAENAFKIIESKIDALKEIRKTKSEELQERLFRSYIVHNSAGDEASIMDIFAAKGIVPPGGTGDCAGVKLLEYAYLHNLTPLALGEFWLGAPLVASTRLSNRFYPSCTAKCGPVLEWMTSRKALSELGGVCPSLEILYEDSDLIAVNKPAGHPSVPGLLSGLENVRDALERQICATGDHHPKLYPVHRLDMDTSGVLLFAKSPEVQSAMMKMFEEGLVQKTYIGVVEGNFEGVVEGGFEVVTPSEGLISLPLTTDFADRPRQKAGMGKDAVTEYKLLKTRKINNKTLSILEFRPRSGRTHQIRIHAANPKGLGRPLLGDTLYGGTDPSIYNLPRRLYLHAASISFHHPITTEPVEIQGYSNLPLIQRNLF